MTTPECPLTDLPPEMCACPRHRGGQAPTEEAIETAGQAFDAMFTGRCERCDHRIDVGQSIARVADGGGYVHAGRCPR